MGEAADKMNHNGSHHNGSHRRVDELRNEIARKRDLLTIELDELRRRRERAVLRSKETAKLAAGAMVGLFLLSSLSNAVLDIFRKDEPDLNEYDQDGRLVMSENETRTVAKKEATTSALVSTIATIVLNELRKMAIEYAKKELRTRLVDGRYRTARTIDRDVA
jgi:hypothetical protein